MSRIIDLKVFISGDIVVQKTDGELDGNRDGTQCHRINFRLGKRIHGDADKALGKCAVEIQIQRDLAEIRLIFRRRIGRKTNRIAEIMHRKTRHNRIQIDNDQRLQRGLVQQNVIALGIIVCHAQRDFTVCQHIAQSACDFRQIADSCYLLADTVAAAVFILGNVAEKGFQTKLGIVEIRDGFHQLAGIEITQVHLEFTERLAGHVEYARVTALVKADAVLDTVHQSPDLAAFLAVKIVLSVLCVMKMQTIPASDHPVLLLLLENMLGDKINVVHHRFRILEHVIIDLLHNITSFLRSLCRLLLHHDFVGCIDVSRLFLLVPDQSTRNTKMLANLCKLLFQNSI